MDVPGSFEWDDRKAATNLEKHHVSFAYAARVFLDPDVQIVTTNRPEDQEPRSKAIGVIEHRLFVVVFTMRGETCRIISARRTNRKEERIYGDR